MQLLFMMGLLKAAIITVLSMTEQQITGGDLMIIQWQWNPKK
jgi:hypothetical protein